MCQTVLREGSLVRDCRLSGNLIIRLWPTFPPLFLVAFLYFANVHWNTCTRCYYAQTHPTPLAALHSRDMHQCSPLQKTPLSNRHQLGQAIESLLTLEDDTTLQQTSDSHVSPVICAPLPQLTKEGIFCNGTITTIQVNRKKTYGSASPNSFWTIYSLSWPCSS